MPTVQIFDTGRDAAVAAQRMFDLGMPQLSEVDRKWENFRLHSRLNADSPLDGTVWRWDRKPLQPGSYNILGVQCADEIEGLAMVNEEPVPSRWPGGDSALYVEYLEVSPWNLVSPTKDRRYVGVGLALLTAAAQLSVGRGFEGRLGLHSLPESEWFYKTRFADMGIDSTESLRSFELDAAEAARLLNGGKR